jgi:CRISPR/Cas system-associated exonuclease Cas4 (RecB family)
MDAAAAAIGDASPMLIVAATRRAADDFARSLCPRLGGRLGVHRRTIQHLAADLAIVRLATHGIARISSLGAEAVAARCAHAIEGREGLSYFGPVRGTPGFGRALARTIHDLRCARIPPEALRGDHAPSDDLGRLLDAYQRELLELRLADTREVFDVALDVATSAEHPLVGIPVVLLDVTPEHRVESELMGALARRAPAAVATVPSTEPEVALALAHALGVERVEHVGDEPRLAALDRARRLVFVSDVPAPPEAATDGSFVLFSAPGEARECVEIVRRIERYALDDGIRFDRMAILLRTPESYQVLVEDALRRARIPGFFSRGTRRPDPSGRALLALLACAAEGLPASRFSEYLSLGQLPEPAADGGPPKKEVPWAHPRNDLQLVFTSLVEMSPEERARAHHLPVPMRWEQLLVDAAVIGGRDRWRRRLAGLEAELRLQLAHLSYEDEGRRQQKRHDLAALDRLERFALPIIETLADLPERAPWRTWLSRLSELATMTLAHPEPVLAILSELEPLGDVGPVALDEVSDVLVDRLSFLYEDPGDHRFGRVFVGSLDEARARTFDVVFVPGLSEGIFPKKAFEDPLLLDDIRRGLSTHLALRTDRIRGERTRLAAAIGAAERAFVCSYSRMDVATGRPRVPSLFALELTRAAEGRLPDLASLEARAAEASHARLGWPAPERPEDAIDDAEYDLAILAPLVFSAPDAIRGKGRYLIEDREGRDRNPHLVRALRARASRWRSPWTAFDGLAGGEPSKAALAIHRLGARSYSPTALQSYAACPYRFLLHAIYRLRPKEEVFALEELDPLTRGSLFHTVQFRLFGALRARNLLPVGGPRIAEVFAVLDEVLDRVATEYEEQLAPAIPQVWRREIEALRLELRRWLRQVAEKDGEWIPIHAELAFGLADEEERDPESSKDPVRVEERFFVRGSIDLVEKSSRTGLLRVTDHKTGKAPDPRPLWIGGGEALQPLVYALAAEGLLAASVGEGRLYYCTTRGGFDSVVIPASPTAREHIAHVLETVDRAVADAFLPAAPRAHACAYCDYTTVCGPDEEIRVQRKTTDGLEPLIGLRGIR